MGVPISLEDLPSFIRNRPDVQDYARRGAQFEQPDRMHEILTALQLAPLMFTGAGAAAGLATRAGGTLAGRGLGSLLASEAGSSALPAAAGQAARSVGGAIARHPIRAGLGGLVGYGAVKGFGGADEPPAPGMEPMLEEEGGGLQELLAQLGGGAPDDTFAAIEQQRAGAQGQIDAQQGDLQMLRRLIGGVKQGVPGRQAYGIWEDMMGDRQHADRKEEEARRETLGSFSDLILDRARQGASLEQIIPELGVLSQFSGVGDYGPQSPEIMGAFAQLFPQGSGQSVIANQSGEAPANALGVDGIRNLEADIKALRQQGYSDAAIEASISPALDEDIGSGFSKTNASWLRSLINDTF